MRVPRLDVHMAEQMLVHVMTVGVWVGRKQAHIFIQIKSAAKRKIELLLLVFAHELTIDALHGLACGQAQDKVRIGTQVMGDNTGDKRRRRLIIGLYDYFHKRALRLSLTLLEGKRGIYWPSLRVTPIDTNSNEILCLFSNGGHQFSGVRPC